ncbi:MAG: lytic transglycosylase domain-containing protein [Clostridia bacterium]|nr:lytic transglycosylase domain-containing protein [Clostridia bacterium]
MNINPVNMYEQKINEINSRISSKLRTMNVSCDFKLAFEEAKSAVSQQDTCSSLVVSNSDGSSSKSCNTDYDSIIKQKSQLYGVNENLIKAVIQAESSFDPESTSSAGAMGLMQLMPSTAKWLGVTDPYDPEENIDGGVRYLKSQINNFGGDVKMALAAYNCGSGRLKSLGITNLDDPSQLAKLPKETRNYVNKIMKSLSSL